MEDTNKKWVQLTLFDLLGEQVPRVSYVAPQPKTLFLKTLTLSHKKNITFAYPKPPSKRILRIDDVARLRRLRDLKQQLQTLKQHLIL